MEASPLTYIAAQPADRRPALEIIHKMITESEPGLTVRVAPMMSKETILYEENGKYMKYGLANVKGHISFHCLPIYCFPALHQKYEPLFSHAKVQKGCINFLHPHAIDQETLGRLLAECRDVNMTEFLEKRKRK